MEDRILSACPRRDTMTSAGVARGSGTTVTGTARSSERTSWVPPGVLLARDTGVTCRSRGFQGLDFQGFELRSLAISLSPSLRFRRSRTSRKSRTTAFECLRSCRFSRHWHPQS